MSKIIQIETATVNLIAELKGLRATLKTGEERAEQITTELKTLADNAPASFKFRNQILANLEERTSNRLDSKALRAAHPDIAEKFTQSTIALCVKVC